MPADPIPLAITLGDINGIGPEIALKAAQSRKLPSEIRLALIGAAAPLERAAKALCSDRPFPPQWQPGLPWPGNARAALWVPSTTPPLRMTPGKIRADAARAAMHWVTLAVQGCQRGIFSGMVTAPICKEGLLAAKISAPGHTEFIANLCEANHYAMILRGGGLTVSLVTRHIPVRAIADAITLSAIRSATLPLHDLLRNLGILNPRIAICGLNPHAGDGGAIGDEDKRRIRPAIASLRRAGLNVSGPHAADTIFWHARNGQYDGIVAMYHDQGLAPLKLVGFEDGVNITAGLPIIRTSPDHGTAFDIAEKNIANPSSMLAAIQTAHSLAQTRRAP